MEWKVPAVMPRATVGPRIPAMRSCGHQMGLTGLARCRDSFLGTNGKEGKLGREGGLQRWNARRSNLQSVCVSPACTRAPVCLNTRSKQLPDSTSDTVPEGTRRSQRGSMACMAQHASQNGKAQHASQNGMAQHVSQNGMAQHMH
eukprot:224999-Pelagomonas_calceolata.AAC.2